MSIVDLIFLGFAAVGCIIIILLGVVVLVQVIKTIIDKW